MPQADGGDNSCSQVLLHCCWAPGEEVLTHRPLKLGVAPPSFTLIPVRRVTVHGCQDSPEAPPFARKLHHLLIMVALHVSSVLCLCCR